MFVMSGKDPRPFWLSHATTHAKFFLTFEAYKKKKGSHLAKKRSSMFKKQTSCIIFCMEKNILGLGTPQPLLLSIKAFPFS